MTDASRRTLSLHSLDATEIERWIAAVDDTRDRTREKLDGLPDSALDGQPAGVRSTIGALLYHTAAIEADWLFDDLMQHEAEHRSQIGAVREALGMGTAW